MSEVNGTVIKKSGIPLLKRHEYKIQLHGQKDVISLAIPESLANYNQGDEVIISFRKK